MADLEGKLRESALNKGPRTVLHPVTGPMVDEKDVAFAREAAARGRAEGLEDAAKVADSFSGKPTSGFTQGKWWEITDRIANAIRALKEKVDDKA